MKAQPISEELLALLCCPETRQPLTLAGVKVLAKLESMRIAGGLRTRGGEEIREQIDGGLLRADGALFFLIRDGIPMLLPEEAIEFRDS